MPKNPETPRKSPADNALPVSFEQAVDAMLGTPPKKKPPTEGKPVAKKAGRKKP